MRTRRNIARLVAFAAVLLTLGCFGGPAKAQSEIPQAAYQGKFSLPFEAHWGKAVLRAGDYQVGFAQGTESVLVIRDAKTLRTVAFESVQGRDGVHGEPSELLISIRGNQRTIHSLRIAELGQTYVFDPGLAHPRRGEEARRIPVVPVLTAQK
jgi:hypothetical protein